MRASMRAMRRASVDATAMPSAIAEGNESEETAGATIDEEENEDIIDFDSSKAMEKRGKIKMVKALRDVGRELWGVGSKTDDQGHGNITRQEYMDYHLSVYKFLSKKEEVSSKSGAPDSKQPGAAGSPSGFINTKTGLQETESVEELLDAYE